jgi:hypothetical protein
MFNTRRRVLSIERPSIHVSRPSEAPVARSTFAANSLTEVSRPLPTL